MNKLKQYFVNEFNLHHVSNDKLNKIIIETFENHFYSEEEYLELEDKYQNALINNIDEVEDLEREKNDLQEKIDEKKNIIDDKNIQISDYQDTIEELENQIQELEERLYENYE